MMRSNSRFWVTAFFLAWLVDFLFWGTTVGVSFFVWVVIAITGGVILAIRDGVIPDKKNLLLMTTALMTAFLVVLRLEPFTRGINIVLSISLLILTAAAFRNGYWVYYRMVDYVTVTFWILLSALVRPIDVFFQKAGGSQPGQDEASHGGLKQQIFPVLRGFIIAIPVVVILGSLLASADLIFAQRLEALLKLFDIKHLPEYLFRLIYILVLGYLFTGVYVQAVRPDREKQKPDPNRQWLKPFLGATESGVILLCVNLLFAFFVVIQFQYFFGGEANISETGYTYSEYARRGFGELVTVAVLSLLLYLGLVTISRQETKKQRISFSVLASILMLLVLVMLGSAFQRLLLYQGAYGFTRLRTYTYIFIPCLGLLMMATIFLEIIKQQGRFALVSLVMTFVFCGAIGLGNVDGLITRENIKRVNDGEDLDVSYIKQLSADATPAMISGYYAGDLSSESHNALGAELACRAAYYRSEISKKTGYWQSFNFSDSKAKKMLELMEKDLLGYSLWLENGSWYVNNAGQENPCD